MSAGRAVRLDARRTTWFVIGLMVLIGAFGSIGHYLLILGHRLAPPSVLAPFIYTQLVWVIDARLFWSSATCPTTGRWPAPASWWPPGSILLHRERQVGKAVTATGVVVE